MRSQKQICINYHKINNTKIKQRLCHVKQPGVALNIPQFWIRNRQYSVYFSQFWSQPVDS